MIRIVKMTFRTEEIENFKQLFGRQKEKIRAFAGCERLELLQDIEQPRVFMTYSWWDSPASLEAYRNSELFRSTWAETKILFAERPEAWSLHQIHKLV